MQWLSGYYNANVALYMEKGSLPKSFVLEGDLGYTSLKKGNSNLIFFSIIVLI